MTAVTQTLGSCLCAGGLCPHPRRLLEASSVGLWKTKELRRGEGKRALPLLPKSSLRGQALLHVLSPHLPAPAQILLVTSLRRVSIHVASAWERCSFPSTGRVLLVPPVQALSGASLCPRPCGVGTDPQAHTFGYALAQMWSKGICSSSQALQDIF